MLNKTYVDAMDRSRKLVPVAINGNTVTCEVHFTDSGYVGKTQLSRHMFTDTKEGPYGRYGYVLQSDL